MQNNNATSKLRDALRTLRDRLPRCVEKLCVTPEADLRAWQNAVDTRLLPRLSPDFPLSVAICGGGSTGKSTLFNSLARENLSVVGGKAGLNRRTLVGARGDLLVRGELLSQLFEPFGCVPEWMTESVELTEPGPPLCVPCQGLPENVLLLDTPDFDTGAEGEYTNRALASPVLEACDILIYVFTNATYNNLSNTQFIRDVLTRIGQRKCVLVYRAYESFYDDQILEHASTVARNLYGEDWEESVLGTYRAHDTNEVASGQGFMELLPVGHGKELMDLLARIDASQLRQAQTADVLRDVASQAEQALDECEVSLDELALYRDAVRIAQSHAVYRALSSLPVQEVTCRLQRLWEETSPPALRFMRNTSRTLAVPVKATFRLAKWVRSSLSKPDQEPPPDDTPEARGRQLEEAAGELHRALQIDQIASRTTDGDPNGLKLLELIERVRTRRSLAGAELPLADSTGPAGTIGFAIGIHPSLIAHRDEVLRKPWKDALADIVERSRPALHVPEESAVPLDQELDQEFRAVIDEFRTGMSMSQRLRETAFASLHLVPPVLAISYVLATGDLSGGAAVVGAEATKVGVAATVYAKVKGLFGLNDLWALVALPANTGLSEADQKRLELMLQPVIQKWFRNRSSLIETIFQESITDQICKTASRRITESEKLLPEARSALTVIQNEVRHHAAE